MYWILKTTINDVSLTSKEGLNEQEFIEESKLDDVLSIRVFNEENEIIYKSGKSIVIKDNNEYYDVDMLISNVFNAKNKSKYKNITVRNYISYNDDGILYISGNRLLKVGE